MIHLNVGRVEHVHSISLPLASSEPEAVGKLAEGVTLKVFAQGGAEFANFLRLPLEVQDMIWKATFEPRTVRAIGYSVFPGDLPWDDYEVWDSFNDDQKLQPSRHCLLLECSRLHVRHLTTYGVCRRSREVALATYGPLLGNNTTPFHSDLDTIELLAWRPAHTENSDITTSISRYASEQGGMESVTLPPEFLQMMAPDSILTIEDGPVYFEEQGKSLHPRPYFPPYSRRWQWAFFGMPFESARNVVLCLNPYTYWKDGICPWANTMFPNAESLTMHTYVKNIGLETSTWGNTEMDRDVYQAFLNQTFESMILKHKEGSWPRLKTIGFTRQSVAGSIPY